MQVCAIHVSLTKRSPTWREQARTGNVRDSRPTRPAVVLLRASGWARRCVVAVCGNGVGHSGPFGAIVSQFKKCASFGSQLGTSTSWPAVAEMSAIHTCDADPHPNATRSLVGSPEFQSTCRFQPHAESSRSSRCATLTCLITAHSTTEVPRTKRFHATTLATRGQLRSCFASASVRRRQTVCWNLCYQ
jgi:hypothetical protein